MKPRLPGDPTPRMWRRLVGVVCAIAAAEVVAVWLIRRTIANTNPIVVPVAIMIALAIGAFVFSVAAAWIAWAAGKALTKFAQDRHGEVCPCCRRRPKLAPDDDRCCHRAPRGWTREQYAEYWSLASSSPFSANLMLRSAVAPPLAVTVVPMVFMAIGAAAMGAFIAWRGDVFGGVLTAVRYLAFFAGFVLAMRGINLHRGANPRCSRCGYEQAPGSTSTHCPECGRFWRGAGGTTRTVLVRDWRFITIGALLIVLATASWISAFRGGSMMRRLQPTSSLIASAGAGISSGTEIWDEIAARKLKLEEERALCDRLLDARHTNPLLFGPPGNWMSTYVASGKATAEQMHRLRAEAFDVRLESPSQARVGDTVRVTVAGNHREEFLPPANGVTVHVGGAWFADETSAPTLAAGGPGHWTLEIAEGKSAPVVTVASDRTGSREIVVRLWFIARSYGHLAEPVDWNDDGTPILPADALWAEPIDVRAPITIVE